MIVIDSSSLAKYLLREINWSKVENILTLGPYSVDHLVKEVSNAIWRHYSKFKRIDRDVALKLFEVLSMFVKEKVITLEPQDRYLVRAFEITLEYSTPIYDTLYIAQAEKLRAKLLTSDKIQANVAQKIGIEVIYIP
ncbi:MAG: type II toxin-antitoxin system VapC family toxin [Ignisphaera sp.]